MGLPAALAVLLQAAPAPAAPPAAEPPALEGSVKLSCAAAETGRLQDCEILSEEPPGHGFGRYAVRLAEKRMQARRSAEPLPPRLEIPFQFKMTEEEAEAAGIVFSGPPVITEPAWIRRPNGNDVDKAYPGEARRKGLEGRAYIWCRIAATGWTERCRVLEEEPAGWGFGAGALKLALGFRMALRDKAGQPTPGRPVIIPITLQLPDY